jgi:hypothetical protein
VAVRLLERYLEFYIWIKGMDKIDWDDTEKLSEVFEAAKDEELELANLGLKEYAEILRKIDEGEI